MRKTIFILALAAILASSCNDSVLINQFHDLPEDGWEYENVVYDSFEVSNPNHYHLISSNLRIDGDYLYSNIHLKMILTDPEGISNTYKLPITLAEKSGKWTGSGLGNTLSYQLPVLHRKVLDKKGMYKVSIAQDMRIKNLMSVLAVGIKVEQQEEIY